MTQGQSSTTFSAEALWAKSTDFIARGLTARDEGDELEFHLWCALALELIGKSALATVSPALVADPNHFPSMLDACGGKAAVDKKSITARTAFERLKDVNPKFDEHMKNQSIAIAGRRNAELHSGDSPTVGLDQRVWVPTFWRCATTIVEGQGRAIHDWIGVEEGKRVEIFLADVSKLLQETVRARVARRKSDYDRRFPPGSPDRATAATHAAARTVPHRVLRNADAVEEHTCPSCECQGWMLGYESGEDVDGPHVATDIDGEVYAYEIVTTFYSVEGFRCEECGLRLEGREETEAADLPETFQRDESRAPQYEEDYGNE